jgi:hypothetical protein
VHKAEEARGKQRRGMRNMQGAEAEAPACDRELQDVIRAYNLQGRLV